MGHPPKSRKLGIPLKVTNGGVGSDAGVSGFQAEGEAMVIYF